MLRDENYQQRRQRFRKFNYGSDEYEATNWYWNMNHQPNGNVSNAKKPRQKSKNVYEPSSRSAIVSSSSGFYSFFRWFKRDQDKSRGSKDISYPHELTSSTDTLEYDVVQSRPSKVSHLRRKLRTFESNDNISPPTSPRISQNFSQSSSCDSVFSTASSFAFVPPIKYLLNRNQKQVSFNLDLHNLTLMIFFYFYFFYSQTKLLLPIVHTPIAIEEELMHETKFESLIEEMK
jgi:hypothetical protein